MAENGGVTVENVYRKFLRPGWVVGHLLVVLAVLICLRLGRWQWHRLHEGGTVQNLGYAILWPVFGAAFLYMWFRFLQLELHKDVEEDAELTELAAGDRYTGNGGNGMDAGRFVADPDAAAVSERPHRTPPGADEVAVGTERGLGAVGGDIGPGAERVPVPASPPDAGVDIAGNADADAIADARDQAHRPPPTSAVSRRTRSRGETVVVATVGEDDESEDSELAAYNRALAALAEKDRRRAR